MIGSMRLQDIIYLDISMLYLTHLSCIDSRQGWYEGATTM